MKTNLLILIIALFAPYIAICQTNGENNRIFWNGGSVPDNTFREYLLGKYDTNHDGVISEAEADAVTEMVLRIDNSKPTVTSLEGIENFRKIENLNLIENIKLVNLNSLKGLGMKALLLTSCGIKELNLSDFPTLEALVITGEEWESVNFDNPALRHLSLEETTLEHIDLSKLKNLEELYVDNTGLLSEIDLSNLNNLKEIDVCGDNLTSLKLSDNVKEKLIRLSYSGKNVLSVNLSELTNLESLRLYNYNGQPDLSQNLKLKELSIYGGQLTELDLSNLPNLEKLDCSRNKLENLDLSNNPRLKELDCSANILTGLDLSNLPNLEKLDCSRNKLENLDLSNNPRLKELDCSANILTGLDLSNLPNLEKLDCSLNKLESLDLSNNNKLTNLECTDNRLKILDISVCPAIKNVRIDYNELEKFNFSHTELESLNYRGAFKSKGLHFYGLNIIYNFMVDSWIFTGASEPKTIEGEPNNNQLLRDIIRFRQDEADKRQEEAKAQKEQEQQMAAQYKREIIPYISRNDWEGADRFAADALSKLPNGDAFLYFVRAKAYYLRNLDFEVSEGENMTEYFKAYRKEARYLADLCSKSISLDPSYSNEAYLYRGLAYIVLEMADNAVNDFRCYAQGNEAYKAICHYNMGISYKNSGRYSYAIEEFKKARQYSKESHIKERCLRHIKECQQKMYDNL